jgi:hypothetical protein
MSFSGNKSFFIDWQQEALAALGAGHLAYPDDRCHSLI